MTPRLATLTFCLTFGATACLAQTLPAPLCYLNGEAYSEGGFAENAGMAMRCVVPDGAFPTWRPLRGPAGLSCEYEDVAYSSGAEIIVGERRLNCCGGGWTPRRATCDVIQDAQ